MTGWIILIVVVIILLYILSKYNGFIVLRNRIKNAWAQINVELKRRYDLIPNLVNAVKGYMQYEKEVLENVVKARSMAIEAKTVKEQGEAETELTKSLKTLFAVMENYPELKANENVLKLQEELTATENRIAFSRQFYNDIVMRYNAGIQMFPGNIIAGMFNFKAEEYFEIELPEEKEVPKVNLGL
jgi:LemA protein